MKLSARRVSQMRLSTASTFLLLGSTVTLACSDREPPPRSAELQLQATARAAQSDSELTSYIAWYRDWKILTNRHKAELDAESQRLTARYSFAETNQAATDTALLALLQRQRSEMAPLMSRVPRGLTAEALRATLPGLGRMVLSPTGMTYVPGRDERVLAAARGTYGDAFVSWVLAHEQTIHATLGAGQ